MTTLIETKTDKKREDWREMCKLHFSYSENKREKENIKKEIKNLTEEHKKKIKKLKLNFSIQAKKTQKLKDSFDYKSELFTKNYGKSLQLQLF